MDLREKRVHPRIELSYPIFVSIEGRKYSGNLQDVSHGGARVLLSHDATFPETAEVELMITIPQKLGLSIFCKIRRQQKFEDSVSLGLEFTSQDHEFTHYIADMLHFFISSTESDSSFKHIAKRIPIELADYSGLHAVIEHISYGGAALTINQELPLYDTLELTLTNIGSHKVLSIKGTVVHQYPLPNSPYFRVGLELDEMDESLKKQVDAIIMHMTTPS